MQDVKTMSDFLEH